MALEKYRAKRRFDVTPEPAGVVRRRKGALQFVIQKHAATRLHYDFRLEHGGVLWSWAVPKGPSFDPADKRLAVHVEDHPIDYASFEGVIPAGQYGAGRVIVWDRGTWTPIDDPSEGMKRGKLAFELEGEKLQGRWALIRMHGRDGSDRNWLLVKEKDEHVRPARQYDVTSERPESVSSGRTIEEIGRDPRERTWQSKRKASARARSPRKSRSTRRARSPRPEEVPGAKTGALPRFVAPQLATLVDEAPAGEAWLHEVKFDGYRLLARLDQHEVRWISRNGLDWSERVAPVSNAVSALPCRSALIDGEVVVLLRDGRSDFHALQQAFGEGSGANLVYYAFDLLHLDGLDLRNARLEDRKEALRRLLAGEPPKGKVRFSDHVVGEGERFYSGACRAHLEGMVSKLRDDPYHSGRTRTWLKVKCVREQELVVVGYSAPKGTRHSFGALLLGYYEGDELRYAGRVGAGFDARSLDQLYRRLHPLEIERRPLEVPRGVTTGDVTWVEPKVVVEVRFTEWTGAGALRHPVFQGIREDKPASEVRREEPVMSPSSNRKRPKAIVRSRGTTRASARTTSRPRASTSESAEVAGIALTHPDRVLYAEQGITKLELALYYERVAKLLLPHISERPLSIVRCPRGAGEACFFQKHSYGDFPPGVESVDVPSAEGKVEPYLMVNTAQGLVALVQMGALELHPWGSRRDQLERPDQMIFDFDPGPDVTWERVAEGARQMRKLMEVLDLPAFLKTTGGKGLHVVVPLQRVHTWDEVKSFSHAVALAFVRERPREYVEVMTKSKRQGRIFVDYLRNGRGATAVAAYSTRARTGAPVATPITWKELDRGVRPNQFDVRNLEQRLKRGFRDPWADLWKRRARLTDRVRRALERSGANGAR